MELAIYHDEFDDFSYVFGGNREFNRHEGVSCFSGESNKWGSFFLEEGVVEEDIGGATGIYHDSR